MKNKMEAGSRRSAAKPQMKWSPDLWIVLEHTVPSTLDGTNYRLPGRHGAHGGFLKHTEMILSKRTAKQANLPINILHERDKGKPIPAISGFWPPTHIADFGNAKETSLLIKTALALLRIMAE